MRLTVENVAPQWAKMLTESLNRRFNAVDNPTRPVRLPRFTTADLPSASDWEGCVVYDTTTNTMKVSNGTSWS